MGSVVVAEVLELAPHIALVLLPVAHSFEPDASTRSDCSLRSSATVQLKRPGGISVEVEHFESECRVFVHEVVPEVDLRVGVHLLISGGDPLVEAMDVQVLEPVGSRLVADISLSFNSVVEAKGDINNDLVLSKALCEAALDSSVDVDVPDSATIHVVCPVPVLRREDSWDGAR